MAKNPFYDVVGEICADLLRYEAKEITGSEFVDRLRIFLKPVFEKAEKWDGLPKEFHLGWRHGDLQLIPIWEKLSEQNYRLKAVKDFVLSQRDNIEKDMENFGMLKPVLEHFLRGEET